MNRDEIRAAFLSFFEGKGHKIMPSSSLVPHGDPTLLLTTAGMVQFKPYFLGEAVPPKPRLTTCQKCFRTTDVESVGDSKHLTFFEMLGNFSIGDYFKKEAIPWAWEFVTGTLGIAPERLWITVFHDDDEAFGYWRQIGIPESRLLRYGEEDNFWGPAGDSGPCGPCSEIHYDFGKQVGCGKPTCAPSCGCGRFSEIWNLVFTQFNQDVEGNRTPLPRPNIDTGMGLERIVAAFQNKKTVYDTEVFVPLLERVSRLSGKKYGSSDETDNAMRIVAEHSRGLTFLIADGVIPSNEGRGYVLRRVLRRAALFGRRLGLEKPFLAEMAQVTVEQMGRVYPELGQRRDFLLKVIQGEEERFSQTLSAGLELLESIFEGANEAAIDGKQAFKLYDTFGFPVELTIEMAKRRGLSVDMDGFNEEMEKQRERARKAELYGGKESALKEAAVSRSYESTPFVGYHDLKHRSVVIELMVDGQPVETLKPGQEASLVLESTPFYGEMGGQVGDTGEIRGTAGKFRVANTVRIPPGIIVHRGQVTEGTISVGEEVEAEVDRERRMDIARNHTTTHLLQFALRRTLGEHVQQRGSLVTPELFRFDFSHLTSLTSGEIKVVQDLVNEQVRRNLPVYAEEMPYKKAVADGAMALFDEKYGETVRVMRIGKPPISAELCGGTHVDSTGEIGLFQLVSEMSIGAGLRRIVAVTGKEAVALIEKRCGALEQIGKAVGASTDDVPEKVLALVDELDKERKQRLNLEKELGRLRAEALLGQVEVVNGVNLLVAKVPSSRLEVLREMSDLTRDRLKSAVVLLGSVYEDKPVFLAVVTPDLVERGYNAGNIVREVAKVTGGGGGGKPGLAQAGGKFKEKLDEALQLARGLVRAGK